MKRFSLFLATAFVAFAVSCSKDEGVGAGDNTTPEPITISLATSGFDINYTPLAVGRGVSPRDLLAVQVYKVEGATETPYAYGLFEDWSTLSFDGFTNTSYRVVATWVEDGTADIYNDAGIFGLPFSTEVVADMQYSSTEELTTLDEGTAKLASDDTEYAVPTINRYYGDFSKTITAEDATITIPMKRMSFGVEIEGLDGDATIQIAGAPEVTLSAGGMQLYSLYDIATAYETSDYKEAFAVVITKDVEIFNATVDFYRNMMTTFTYSDGALAFDFEAPFEGEVRVLTFEDADYRAGKNYLGEQSWSSLIDDEAYGSLLYSDTQYKWTDSNNTGLMSSVNPDTYGMFGYAFWAGGIAVSNYYKEAALGVADTNQLSVPCGSTGAAGADGSANFAVVYNNDVELSFADNSEYVIKSMDIANTSYMLSSCEYGDASVVGGLKDTEDVWVKVTGYNAEGESVGDLTYYLAKDGVEVQGWNEWDLSSLGAVSKIVFTFDSDIWSDNQGAHPDSSLVPAYLAIDNIAVQF